MKPIALTGKARAGKDMVAEYLVSKYGYTRFAFGDELKRYAHELYNVSDDEKPRALYQKFGQYCREIEPDIWVRKCFDAIYERQLEINPFDACLSVEETIRPVITDLRQPNEYDRCLAEGFVIIRVEADDDLRLARMKAAGDVVTPADLSHETESHVDSFAVDYVVENNDARPYTYEQIDAIMAELGVNPL